MKPALPVGRMDVSNRTPTSDWIICFVKAKHSQWVGNDIDRTASLCSIPRVMKTPKLLSLGALAVAAVSCGSFKNLNRPLSGGGFDPLDGPGSPTGSASALVAPTKPSYKRGQWVETSMPNATFFRAIPKGSARADKVLAAGTPMKVVSSTGTYLKVELDSGDIGFVPEIMVIERSAAGSQPGLPAPDFGPVPPPVEPGINTPEVAPIPEVPDSPPPPPVPNIPSPSVPETVPTVPDVAPPPEVPGITDPTSVD